MEGVTSKAEQVRLAHRKAQRDRCAVRLATFSISCEETAQRRHQRQKAESDGEAEGAATATLEHVARIPEVRPTRCPPDVVLEHPHQADPQYHQDWTTVEGSNWDPEKWEREQELRERRNILIQASAGSIVAIARYNNSLYFC